MRARQEIFRVRREYNQWVGNQTLEDYALRFTAKKARRWSISDVGHTALGATAFLALEALAAGITLSYGFANAMFAIFAVAAVIFVTGFPIAYHAAKHGLDIDLLTRGAGFGYLGSTVTSLVYASFTFIFFAIEAAIMAAALQALFGLPLQIGYIICSLAVIPIVTHGITAISRFQIGTQPLWLALQCLALVVVAWNEIAQVEDWTRYAPSGVAGSQGFDLILFGAASSVLFAMVAQIGEQVDYLRFLPTRTLENRKRWWFWLILAGPGWIFIGVIKMLLGSFLAYLAISQGASEEQAIDPTLMYQMVFNYLVQSPEVALMLAGVMVIVSQMKINVTNAYAGSIAWSNFFSRLTHSHPGRVVWVVFNVLIALVLMELGIYRSLESILSLFAIISVAWLGSLAADLLINKPLGLSPSYVEFKRAHLYDINPVGIGSMLLASVVGVFCYIGSFGVAAQSLAHFITLAICFVTVPSIAWLTGGQFYLARRSPELIEWQEESPGIHTLECCICETSFETEDMSYCPAYRGAICSLCCSLDSRCMDSCKPGARFSDQVMGFFRPLLPRPLHHLLDTRLAQYVGILGTSSLAMAAMLSLLYMQLRPQSAAEAEILQQAMLALYFVLLIIAGILSWLFLLAHESRVFAQQESSRQTQRLMREVEAHRETDEALQQAKDQAEQASNAKSRYIGGISHELRSPLQSILGYAQLLSQHDDMPARHLNALRIVRRSGEYLSDLIEGLLDISKIEAGRLDIYRNEVKLRELISQLVEMFSGQAEAKGIRFTSRVQDQLPELVITDEKRLRQILINLLSNAIKYTEKGSVEFHVRYRNQVAAFSVVDTGVGIQDSDIERILYPFERVRDYELSHVPGTGLGLTIVRLLTEVMGGELTVASVPGEGSRFTVSLMLSRKEKSHEAALPHRKVVGYGGEPRVVMVVDDEPIHRGLMADSLTPLGFTVMEAPDARHCETVLGEATPDIFILDVNMPGVDGLKLAQRLRDKGYDQPILMLSADAYEPQRMYKDRGSYDEYLVKPVNTNDLMERLRRLLGLTWRYADESPAVTERVERWPSRHAAALPDHALLRELLAYARIGYRNGVDSKLGEIEAAELLSDDDLGLFLKLSNAMQFRQLVEVIESRFDEQ